MNTNLKKLIKILGDGFFHSGTDLGERLGLTRGGVWKLIQQVQTLGIVVESKTNKGYQIVDGLELLSLDALKANLSVSTQSLIQDIVLLDEVSSTNDFLLKHPPISSGKAVICIAESQTAGRGRFGRKWFAPYASNLYLSLLWRFPMDAGQLSGLSLGMAVGIAKALSRYGIQEHIQLKWPNDVLWRGKKLSGCLIEVHGEAYDACHTVIGIGMNLNMPQEVGQEIQADWVDIRQIIQNIPERNRLTALILEEVLRVLPTFQMHGLAPFKSTWERLSVSLNKTVSIVNSTETVTGIDRGIDARGCLLLEKEKTLRAFSGGEVSLRLNAKRNFCQ